MMFQIIARGFQMKPCTLVHTLKGTLRCVLVNERDEHLQGLSGALVVGAGGP
jgi:hypothetical protein